MATGRDTQLTKQVGEYLVAAELARHGLLAATFSGSVPELDIVASGPNGGHVPVQVKARARGDWQLDVRDFTDVVLDGDCQIVRGRNPSPYPGLIFVFVAVGRYGTDQFFVIDWDSLSARVTDGYSRYLAAHGGRRPKNSKSFHTALRPQDLVDWPDKWGLIL